MRLQVVLGVVVLIRLCHCESQAKTGPGFVCEHSGDKLGELRRLKAKAMAQERLELQHLETRENQAKQRAEGAQWQAKQDAERKRMADRTERRFKKAERHRLESEKKAHVTQTDIKGLEKKEKKVWDGSAWPPRCGSNPIQQLSDVKEETVYYNSYSQVEMESVPHCGKIVEDCKFQKWIARTTSRDLLNVTQQLQALLQEKRLSDAKLRNMLIEVDAAARALSQSRRTRKSFVAEIYMPMYCFMTTRVMGLLVSQFPFQPFPCNAGPNKVDILDALGVGASTDFLHDFPANAKLCSSSYANAFGTHAESGSNHPINPLGADAWQCPQKGWETVDDPKRSGRPWNNELGRLYSQGDYAGFGMPVNQKTRPPSLSAPDRLFYGGRSNNKTKGGCPDIEIPDDIPTRVEPYPNWKKCQQAAGKTCTEGRPGGDCCSSGAPIDCTPEEVALANKEPNEAGALNCFQCVDKHRRTLELQYATGRVTRNTCAFDALYRGAYTFRKDPVGRAKCNKDINSDCNIEGPCTAFEMTKEYNMRRLVAVNSILFAMEKDAQCKLEFLEDRYEKYRKEAEGALIQKIRVLEGQEKDLREEMKQYPHLQLAGFKCLRRREISRFHDFVCRSNDVICKGQEIKVNATLNQPLDSQQGNNTLNSSLALIELTMLNAKNATMAAKHIPQRRAMLKQIVCKKGACSVDKICEPSQMPKILGEVVATEAGRGSKMLTLACFAF